MFNRRVFFGLFGGALAALGLSPKKALSLTGIVPPSDFVGPTQSTISLRFGPKGELWRDLASATLVDNGYVGSTIRGDELRDLAGALLRAADIQQEKRTFIFDVPKDAAFEGRYGEFNLGFEEAHGANSGLQIRVELEPMDEYYERNLDPARSVRHGGVAYDDDRRMWHLKDRGENGQA